MKVSNARIVASWALSITSVILLPVVVCGPTLAARFPNAVEKEVVLTGQDSESVAELFGFDKSRSSSISLPLGRNDAWAVYLLKKDTKVELSNDEGMPARQDTLAYESAPKSSLTIGTFWLDLGTRLPQSSPGDYSFSSGFIPGDLEQTDQWTQLVKRLKKQPQWNSDAKLPHGNNGASKQYSRSFSFTEGTRLTIDVYPDEDYARGKPGHVVYVTVHKPR